MFLTYRMSRLLAAWLETYISEEIGRPIPTTD